MALTIELPDDLAERLRVLAAEAGQDINEFAVATLREVTWEEPDPELIEALREGIAELEAGNLLTIKEVDAEIDARIAEAREQIRMHKIGKLNDV